MILKIVDNADAFANDDDDKSNDDKDNGLCPWSWYNLDGTNGDNDGDTEHGNGYDEDGNGVAKYDLFDK